MAASARSDISAAAAISTSRSSTKRRLKREECKRTKHDSAFSPWKILVGPSDWEDYLLNKEGGAEKYRTQNLPNCSSCSGVYELGIATSLPKSGRRGGDLSSERIITVYIGQADNVRTRLQQYGREGAHLENGRPNSEQTDSKAQGLFKEVFSKGYAIVYRWAPMKNKIDAERTEARLLDTFDYAWNKERNGVRRCNDIHQKLECHSSNPTQLVVSKLHIFRPKKVGIRIRKCEPFLLENRSSFYKKQVGGNLLSRIFKFRSTRPIGISKESGLNEDNISFCGVALGQGSVCTRMPVAGRKRCADHKGMKINGSTPKLIGYQCGSQGFLPTCGVPLADGSFCTREPITGRKRCQEHKGRRTSEFISSPVIVEGNHFTRRPILKPRISFVSGNGINQNTDTICWVDLTKGSFCTKPPVLGQPRCEEHKGLRLTEHKLNSLGNSVNGSSSLACGAVTHDGSLCMRKPCNDGKWCGKHGSYSSSGSISCRSYSNEDYFYPSTCAAITQRGNRCSRQATAGRQTCWQH